MNTTSSLSQIMQTFYDRMFLDRAKPELVYWQFGQKRNIPANNGKLITFSRYTPMAAATTPLSEGQNPAGSDLTAENVTATIAEYGDYTQISSLVSATAIDPKISEKVELFSDQAALTVDNIVRNTLYDNCTQILYANGKTAIGQLAASSDILQTLDIQKAVRKLKKKKAKKIKGYWMCIINPDTEYDITRDPGWVNAGLYSGSTPLYDGEVGRWFNTRFVYSTEPKIQTGAGASGADVYSNFMFGDNAFGVIDIMQASASGNPSKPQIIVKMPGPNTTSDPLNRFSTCGWQLTFGQQVLNANWIVNIKCAITPES